MGPEELTELVAIARRHYVDGVSRVDIGNERGLSRFKVGRILQAAREAGIVRIEVRAPAGIDYELSEELRLRYGLRRALAVQAADETRVRGPLGQVAGELLREIVTGDDVLGIDCGRTLREMTGHLGGIAGCDVVQITGMGGALGDTATDITRVVSEASGGRVFSLFAPIVVADSRTAEAMRSHRAFRSTFAAYARVTKAVVAIGAWSHELSQIPALIGDEETARFAASGVVGETGALLLDAEGRRVLGLDARRVAISEAQLRAVPDVIGVGGGRGKTTAVHAILTSGLLNSVVTDVHLARRLLRRR
ncbi:DNA-binding transcriptional regulator LsrR (DeoR family) [Kineococcus radiotolerans]|uniref:DNA-binding transcriptional regulator LsrR (DeoR family) n=1 Tax=Kineococcus radiotolerans TaxID=131568 RepID=A0A7W4XW72_KINRA|nr:sugar-binding domain-containing protein [Kineococcus radiotolerans]MBB2899850.1 DNA-binding transcriptional regulator LsrR (DeoR family) [Kineococcus radiotolerans]